MTTVAHAFVELMNGHNPDAVEHWDQLDGQAFFAQLTGEAGGQ